MPLSEKLDNPPTFLLSLVSQVQQQPNLSVRQRYPASPHLQRRIHLPFLSCFPSFLALAPQPVLPRQKMSLAPPTPRVKVPGWRCHFSDNCTSGRAHWQGRRKTTQQQAEGPPLCWISKSSWTTMTYIMTFLLKHLSVFVLIISVFLV